MRELVARAGHLDELEARAGQHDLIGADHVEGAERQERHVQRVDVVIAGRHALALCDPAYTGHDWPVRVHVDRLHGAVRHLVYQHPRQDLDRLEALDGPPVPVERVRAGAVVHEALLVRVRVFRGRIAVLGLRQALERVQRYVVVLVLLERVHPVCHHVFRGLAAPELGALKDSQRVAVRLQQVPGQLSGLHLRLVSEGRIREIVPVRKVLHSRLLSMRDYHDSHVSLLLSIFA